jgi:hypothetical protein
VTINQARLLASRPLPARKISFDTARAAHSQIEILEAILGFPPGPKSFNLVEANSRFHYLESLRQAHCAPAAQSEKSSVLAQYNAITDPIKRTEFYAANKSAYDSEFRAAQPKPRQPSNPFAPEDAAIFATYQQIAHAGDKVAYYRANSRAIDRALEAENFQANQ